MDGGVVDQTLTPVADKASSWIRQRVAEADDDYLSVWRQSKSDPSLLRTAFRGSTVWVFAPLGEDAVDYVQLAVHQLQEVVLGPLIDGTDWPAPYSIEDLCDGPATLSVDLKPIGDLHNRLRRAVHADSFLAELTAAWAITSSTIGPSASATMRMAVGASCRPSSSGSPASRHRRLRPSPARPSLRLLTGCSVSTSASAAPLAGISSCCTAIGSGHLWASRLLTRWTTG
jgi:hypothetical protein